MDDNQQQKKKPKFVPQKITLKQSEPDPVEKISENGSLILQEFRLNQQGIKVQQEQTGQGKINLNKKIVEDFTFTSDQSIKNLSLDTLTTIGSLGEGASGKVEKVRHEPTGEIYAMKKIPISTDETQLKYISDELKLMLECDSPYVVKCYGAFYKQGTLHLILEYMNAGSIYSLLQKVKRFTEPIMAILAHQILLGLDYLHNKKKIIHRDIKPQNILINSKGEIKITDFGISSQVETLQKRQTYVGTAIYMSPERLTGDKYGRDSDLWSVGVMMAECLLGEHPIKQKGVNFIEMVQSIQNFNPQALDKLSLDMKNLISWCCHIKVEARPTTQDLLNSKTIKRAEKVDKAIFIDWLKFVYSK